jgi:hypothetical protein
MHPEISLFPSKLFYESRLKDGPDMDKLTTAEWHDDQMFSPYQFLNILDGKESMGSGKSLYNTHEAEAAVTLVDMLASRYPSVNVSFTTHLFFSGEQGLTNIHGSLLIVLESSRLTSSNFVKSKTNLNGSMVEKF